MNNKQNNNKEVALENILAGIPTNIANLQLPDNILRDYYRDEADRVIWIDDQIDDSTTKVMDRILRYNYEDKNIPVEERKPIKIFIDTPGGSVIIMWSIVNAIKLSKTPVWTINWCTAYSAGATILAAGHKRFAMPGSTALVHSGSCYYGGNQEQVDAAKKFFDRLGKEADEFLLAQTKIDKKTFNKKKASDWYFNTQECLESGLVDKIVESFDEIL